MTTTIQTTNLIGPGIQFTFASSNDNYYVLQGVTVASTNGDIAIDGGFSSGTPLDDLTLAIDGTVLTGNNIAVFLDGNDNAIEIGPTGVVRSTDQTLQSTAVAIRGADLSVFNAGLISGQRSIGLFVGGPTTTGDTNASIINTGMIVGATGVHLGFKGGGEHLVNSGTIAATNINPHLTDIRYNHGVFSEGNNAVITNMQGGIISASAAIGSGISIGSNGGGDGTRVINHGQITSAFYYGVDFFYMVNTETAELINTGVIQGQSGSFRGNESGETVINTGQMIGDVDMGAGADTFDGRGGTVQDVIDGGEGNDTLRGGDSAETVLGSAGSDLIGGGAGNDSLDGGTENDTVNGGAGNDTLLGGNGNDSLTGGGDDDVLNGNSKNDTLLGGAGDDTLDGGNDDDVLYGQQGNDELFGTAGFDTLNGGGGDDLLDGGGRVDYLNGGGGNDTLIGAGGNDRFIFERHAGHDVITDMTNGSDVIDLSAFGLQNFNRLNLLGALSQESGGTLIDFTAIGGSGSVWLEGVALSTLNSTDFVF